MAMKTNSLAAAAAKIQGKESPTNVPAKTELKKILAPSVRVFNMLAKYKNDIEQALPTKMTPDRFARIAVTTICRDPKLIQSVAESPDTLVAALMTSAQLGLEPNTPLGQCFLVARKNFNKVTQRKEMQVSFEMGYQGEMTLCYRSGEVTLIRPVVIYAKDEWDYEEGLDPKLYHKPYRGGDRGEAVAYYCVVTMRSGVKGFSFMTREQVLAHAKQYSPTYSKDDDAFNGPWESDFDSMAKKTVLLQATKYMPKSAELARQLLTDCTTKSNIGKDMTLIQSDDYIDAEEIPQDFSSSPDGAAQPAQRDPSAQPATPTPPANRGGAAQTATNGELDLSDIK